MMMKKYTLKHTYLGYETKEPVDVVTGEITSAIQSLRVYPILMPERWSSCVNYEAWAMILTMTIPQSCEFHA